VGPSQSVQIPEDVLNPEAYLMFMQVSLNPAGPDAPLRRPVADPRMLYHCRSTRTSNRCFWIGRDTQQPHLRHTCFSRRLERCVPCLVLCRTRSIHLQRSSQLPLPHCWHISGKTETQSCTCLGAGPPTAMLHSSPWHWACVSLLASASCHGGASHHAACTLAFSRPHASTAARMPPEYVA
jgi:hypothetical protein